MSDTAKRRPPAAGRGRKPGSKNRVPAQLGELILGALSDVGGREYLARCFLDPEPRIRAAALGLLARLLPPPQAEAAPEVIVRWEP